MEESRIVRLRSAAAGLRDAAQRVRPQEQRFRRASARARDGQSLELLAVAMALGAVVAAVERIAERLDGGGPARL